MLKPCKVKRFLATEDLSVVGLVTGSSESNGFERGSVGRRNHEKIDGTEKKKLSGIERERGTMNVKVMKNRAVRRLYSEALT